MRSSSSETNEGRLAWFVVVLLFSLGIVAGATAHDLPEHIIERSLALGFVGAGLSSLFSLAAFGPKAPRERVNPPRVAASAAGVVLIGVSELIQDFRTRLAIGCLALLVIGAAALKVPKIWFVPKL